MELSRIKSFAQEWGYEDVRFRGRWKDYDVYSGVMSEDMKGAAVGLPSYILADDQKIRVSRFPEEYDEIFDLVEPKEDEEDEDFEDDDE